jgi:hypothetical protein
MYYIYFWLRENGTPYYVGKGKEDRAFVNYSHTVSRPVNKELILLQNCDSETEAFEMERFFVSYYGRLDVGTGILRNRSDGGDGNSGAVWTSESRKRLSRCKMGNKNRLGIPPTKAAKDKISEKIKKLWENPEYREHMSASHKGKGHKHTEATKNLLREKHNPISNKNLYRG